MGATWGITVGAVTSGRGAASTAAVIKSAALAAVLGLVLALLVAIPVAGAEPVDCDEGPSWTVGIEAEFNDAIACYNAAAQPGRYTITFSSDIATSSIWPIPSGEPVTAAFRWITQDDAGLSLTIDGGGFSAWGGGVADTTLGVARTETSPVTITNMFVTAGGITGVHAAGSVVVISDTIVSQNANGVFVDGSLVTIVQSVIVENGGAGVDGHGVINAGTTEIRSSVIDSNEGLGVLNEAGDLTLAESSVIANAEGGVVNLGVDEPATTIIDSTIADNGFDVTSLFGGVHAANGTMSLRRVTVAGNGNGVDASLSTTAPGTVDADFVTVIGNAGNIEVLGQVTLRSSIAERCGPGVDDAGYNVGGCFRTAAVQLESLADNGCLVSTPQGCPATFMPTSMSSALGRGDCSAEVDQRDQTGLLRTPLGFGCEAGAVDRDDYTPAPRGDVNCDGAVNIVDALVMAQFTVSTRSDQGHCPVNRVDGINPAAGDLNSDAKVDIIDALIVAQCDAGITNPFC